MSSAHSPGRTTIGVFDSGFGGLTVLRALMHHLPGADFLYLGDSARLPYGSKSADTVTRYTAAAVHALAERGADLVVIACNTASALALPRLVQSAVLPQAVVSPVATPLVATPLVGVPLVGVIQPGAAAAAAAVPQAGAPILVLATEATVASHAYAAACAQHGLSAVEKACPLLVPLVEEGWTAHTVTRQVVDIYLCEATAAQTPAAILLGCTHYPLLRPLLEQAAHSLLGPIPVVDSAEATALHVRTLLPHAAVPTAAASGLHCFATDSPEKFQRLGGRFLARTLDRVELLDLDA